jgi:hypothetical protein
LLETVGKEICTRNSVELGTLYCSSFAFFKRKYMKL